MKQVDFHASALGLDQIVSFVSFLSAFGQLLNIQWDTALVRKKEEKLSACLFGAVSRR